VTKRNDGETTTSWGWWRQVNTPIGVFRLVAHEFTATTGEDGRTGGETCPLLLALAGGEPSDEAAVWEYGAADRGAVASGGIAEAVAGKSIQSQEGTEGCLTKPDRKAATSSWGLAFA
jgi:hypothetical protein